jgi:RNA polymerase primary sigma factor
MENRSQCKKRKKSSKRLLSRDEEHTLTYAISDLQKAKQVRNELSLHRNAAYHPSEAEWAKACGCSLLELRRIVHEGKEAKAELISKNAGLVNQIASRYHRRSSGSILTIQDMIQEGNLGLMVAAERFDPSRGFKFSTYAAWWVRQRILRAIADHSRVIRLPVHVHTMLRTIEKTKKEMADDIGRPPTEPELAHNLGISVEKLKMYTDANRNVLSLESPKWRNGKSDDKRTISDGIASDNPTPEDNAEIDFLKQDIRTVMNSELSSRERDVLALRYGLDDGNPKTVDQVASILDVSRERVRLLEARAINKLRQPGRNYKLKEYVEKLDEPVELERTPEQIWSF